MPTPATSTATAVAASSFLPKQPYISSSLPIPARIPSLAAPRGSGSVGVRICCQVAVSTDVSSSSSSSLSDEELEAESKVGRRIKVKSPLKVYHVPKAPDLDLEGMEGVIKQYVGVWKGKRISANLPFRAEFFVEVPGLEKPVKVVAHLKEDEFEYVEGDGEVNEG